MNSDAIQELVALKPELKASKAKLQAMEAGAFCVHRSWGFGRIQGYDSASRKLLIDFDGKPAHGMDPAFCVTTMEILPETHLLVRKHTEPAKLQELIDSKPAQLIVDALAGYPNKATTGVELENLLTSVVGTEKFKRWWTAAKKALSDEPRVLVPAKRTEVYVLRDEPVSTETDLVQQFNATRSARRRISIAANLLAASSKKDLKSAAAQMLPELATAIKDSNQIDQAERLEGAWVRNDLADIIGEETTSFLPTLEELVSNERTLPEIAEKISIHNQSRFLALIHEAHPLNWKDIAFVLLTNSSGKFTTECINFLIENECSDELAAALTRWQTEQNLRAPVLLWIVKNRNSRKFSKLLHELITPRLLTAIFFAIDYEALQTAGARRIPLGDILSEDTELIPDLLSTADPETARDLANTLLLNQGFEELTKKSLLARFIKLFPGIQSLVSNEAAEKGEALLVSKSSYERKHAEYELIVTKKIPENSKAIAAAREHGDLRENSEYKMAKQDQSVLLGLKGQLERELASSRITDFKDASNDQVGVGSIVQVKDNANNRSVTYTVLGAWDSDPENFVISYKTPLGQALLGKKVGDHIKVKIADSQHAYDITSIKRWVDTK